MRWKIGIILLLMGCLAEMTVAHPTSGFLGAIAGKYIHHMAGFLVLVLLFYWFIRVGNIGLESFGCFLFDK